MLSNSSLPSDATSLRNDSSGRLRILFCGQAAMNKELGASKVLLELGEAMEPLGWDCTFLAPQDLVSTSETPSSPDDTPRRASYEEITALLRAHVQNNASRYDVVDYDHNYLPYPRTDFPPDLLMVARSVLLQQHRTQIRIPTGRTLRKRLGDLLKGRQRQRETAMQVEFAQTTAEQADVINVSSEYDRRELARRGIAAGRVLVIPFGISDGRRGMFDSISSDPPVATNAAIVGFVGSFDYRKGASDFPTLVKQVLRDVPNARFRLLGTRGLCPDAASVYAFFPTRLHPQIEVIPFFPAGDLANLLGDVSVGVFPSYWEGFPFGVLEMLAASIPVVAYDAPGAPAMLPSDYLVAPGDTHAMARTVIHLLQDRGRLTDARIWAKARSHDFTWESAARQTDAAYRERLAHLQASADTATREGRGVA